MKIFCGRPGTRFAFATDLRFTNMDCISTRIPYRQAGIFSRIVTDYIDQAEGLRPFYRYSPTLGGIQKAIAARENVNTERELLVTRLKKQYGDQPHPNVAAGIEALRLPRTFTVTTAHQPNILTGPLYFIYKIVHAIKLAGYLNTSLPQYNFVPVYYMGSEDADLEELGEVHIDGNKLVWSTQQTGAVGRMLVDDDFLRIIHAAEGQLAVMPFGHEILPLLKACYAKGTTVQEATFRFVNALFEEYGLIVLIPDDSHLKKQAAALFADDLLHQTASTIVGNTIGKMEAAGYKIQAQPRDINLFYLKDNTRERIVRKGNDFRVVNTDITFSEAALLDELKAHPERFSPNVILRGLFQEMILPNVAFIGGGGELAYWLQYDDLFTHYNIPYPVLILRNSFLLVESSWQEKIGKTGFTAEDFFLPEQELLNRLVARDSKNNIRFNGSLSQVEQLYDEFKQQAGAVDLSLTRHVDALKTKALHRLQELEKKMLRAEKRKFADAQRRIQAIRSVLFPGNGLQERHDNMLYYYAKWGSDFIRTVHRYSLALEQEFVLLVEK